MSAVPLSDAQLTEEVGAFVSSIQPQRARWEYCLGASHYRFRNREGKESLVPNPRSMVTSAKIVGRRKFWVERAFHDMRFLGYDAALARDEERREKITMVPALFDVGPLRAWEAGHVYFARVVDHPHVVKVGFSRRVHERIDDIEATVKTRLRVLPGQLKVGTLLNEHWWHRDWQKFNITGEWFFDPHMPDRTLPAFLTANENFARIPHHGTVA